MNVKKIATSALAVTLALGSLTNVALANTVSQSINGDMVTEDWRYDCEENTDIKEFMPSKPDGISIRPQYTTVTYDTTGIDGTLDTKYVGSIRTDWDRLFHRTSVTIPKGVDATWTYTWKNTVEDYNETDHNFSAGLSASGEAWVFGIYMLYYGCNLLVNCTTYSIPDFF